jgi:Domain of unknown function (DUF4190)
LVGRSSAGRSASARASGAAVSRPRLRPRPPRRPRRRRPLPAPLPGVVGSDSELIRLPFIAGAPGKSNVILRKRGQIALFHPAETGLDQGRKRAAVSSHTAMNTWVPPLPTNSNPGLKSGLAVTSLVLGIVSILTCGLGFLFAIPAIITGHIAQCRARRSPERFGGGRLAIAGIGMGYLSVMIATGILPHWSPNSSKRSIGEVDIMCKSTEIRHYGGSRVGGRPRQSAPEGSSIVTELP